MSEDKKSVSRRDTLKLATAVSALGVGLGAALSSKDASADGTSINQIKFDAIKIDSLVLTVHKGDPNAGPVHTLDLTPVVTQNMKFAPSTYYLKLTAAKNGAPVAFAIDTFSFK
jgi:hypothetical protein